MPTEILTPSPTIALDDGSGQSVPKTAQAIAGGALGLASFGNTLLQLSRINSDEQRKYGDRLWDWVDKDAVAGSCVDTLVFTALANDLGVVPAFTLSQGQVPTPEEQTDVDNAGMAADWVAETMDGLCHPFHASAREHLRGSLKWGCSLADLQWDVPTDGPNSGLLVLEKIQPKARRAWYFEVDPYFDIQFIVGNGPTGLTRWPREKFAILTWGGTGGDPRGESIYTRAVESWNFRAQMPENHFRFLQWYAMPKVVGKLSAGSMAGSSLDGSIGRNPLAAFEKVLESWINGSAMAVGENDQVQVFETKSTGLAYQQAWDQYAREITIAILLQTRATMEAKHGSKADSGTGQDILGNIIRFVRRSYCQLLETDVYRKIVAYRWGEDFARKYTPSASLGDTEHQDVVQLMQGLAAIGYKLDPSQYPSVDEYLGFLSIRDPQEAADNVDVAGNEGQDTSPDETDTGTDDQNSQSQDDTASTGTMAVAHLKRLLARRKDRVYAGRKRVYVQRAA